MIPYGVLEIFRGFDCTCCVNLQGRRMTVGAAFVSETAVYNVADLATQ